MAEVFFFIIYSSQPLLPLLHLYIEGLKLFGKAHVEVNVSLGQLINNPLFNEAESEFHVLSYFKTKIDIRNALRVCFP